MDNQDKTRDELIQALEKLAMDFDRINELYQNDLAERKIEEQELRKSLSLVEATLESTENGILVINNEGAIVKSNQRFAEMWKIPAEIFDSGEDIDLLNFIINQLSEPVSFLAKVRDLYTEPYAESYDKLYFADGRVFERLSKPMIVNGQAMARVWSFLNITGRLRTETERQVMFEIAEGGTISSNLDEMLSLIHQSLKKVVYAENCFIALNDPETGLFSFPYFVDKYDERPLPVAIGKSCTAYVFRTGRPFLLTPELFLKLSELNEVELVGSPAPSWVGVPLQTPTATIGVLVLQHYEQEGIYTENDISFLSAIGNQVALVIERKKTEEEIIRMNDQLQAEIADKDRFFSIIAHDLRSPFSSFLGFTQLLSEELATLSRMEIQNIASSMKKTAFNVYHLLDSLLEWSRFQRGLTSFNREYFELRPMISECLDLIYDSGKKKKIRIAYEIPSALMVYADKHMLETILRNLLANAVKFTPTGGEVIVSAAPSENNTIEISVKDSGIGMNAEMMGRLFNISDQIRRSGTEGESGSGLGLFICKEFIEKHAGNLRVKSEEGKGTDFYFDLPLKIV